MASSSLSSRAPSAHQPPSRGGALFPVRLHNLLEEETRKGNTDIVSWSPDGQSFKVHDKIRFANEIMPTYFGTSKYRSFQKNLNLWQFKTVTSSASRYLPGRPPRAMGECFHPFFIRDFPVLMERMKRVVVKNPKVPSVEAGPTVHTHLSSSEMLQAQASALAAKNGNAVPKKPPPGGNGTVEFPHSLGSLFASGGIFSGLSGAATRNSLPTLNPLLSGGDFNVLSQLPVLAPLPGNDTAASLLRNSSMSSVGSGFASDSQKSSASSTTMDHGLSVTNDVLRLLASTAGPTAAAAAAVSAALSSNNILPSPAPAPASFIQRSSLTALPRTSAVVSNTNAASLSANTAAAASQKRSNDLVNAAAILLLTEADAQASLAEQRRVLIQRGVLADLADAEATASLDLRIHEV